MISLLMPQQEVNDKCKVMPDYFADLNLDQVVSEMQVRNKEYDLKNLFYTYPDSERIVRFRQEVFRDIESTVMPGAFWDFSKAMRETRKQLEFWKKTGQEQQKSVCFLGVVSEYMEGLFGLFEALSGAKLVSEGLTKVRDRLSELVTDKKMMSCRKKAEQLNHQLSELRFHMTLTDSQMTIATGKKEVLYYDKLRFLFPKQFETKKEGRLCERYYLTSPFLANERLGYLETEAVSVYKKLKPEFFKEVLEFAKTYEDVISEELYELEQELQFYLSYLSYQQEMKKHGCTFCIPELTTDGAFQITEGYDIALAWKNMWVAAETVSNSVEYCEAEKFFVVTGPNQGGKTTFARSIGQIVYFAMQGLPVPAKAARLPYFNGLLTHFSAEESAESGRGKLKEELIRLGPMLKEKRKNCFVILNELFTTAATYDARIMGTRVLKHFILQDCRGIYVTHISELTQEIDGVVSLVAVADGENHKRRTFRLERRPAEGTGYAADIVERHNLTYEDIVERLNRRLSEAGQKPEETTEKSEQTGNGKAEGTETEVAEG